MWGLIVNWLSKVDPNAVIAIVSTVGAWLYHRIAGEKATAIEKIVAGQVSAILAEIAEHIPSNVPIDTWLAGARRYVNDRIWSALSKVKVKRTPALEKIVAGALERATAELAHRIADERRTRNQTPK